MERLQKQVPELSNVDVIVPLGSKSPLNVQIAEQIQKLTPRAQILDGMINKLTWNDVQLSDVWKHEKSMSAADGNPRPWLDAVAQQLASKKHNHPDQPFEIKLVSPGHRRYFSNFYSSTDVNRLNGKTVLMIDDTLEQGSTLKDALRSVSQSHPKLILAYIFLYKVM